VSAYLSREELHLLADDGRTLTVEAGDYLEAVDPLASLALRDIARWASVVRAGAEALSPSEGLVVLEVGSRYALARVEDLIPLVTE
jgi:hypothetical protein